MQRPVGPPRSGLRHPIPLFDLHGAVVDRGQHLRRVAGDDDIDDGRAVALGHALGERGAKLLRVFHPNAPDPHRARNGGVIHFAQIGGDETGTLYGVGMDSDIVTASLKAVASAATRASQKAAAK